MCIGKVKKTIIRTSKYFILYLYIAFPRENITKNIKTSLPYSIISEV